jgi:2-polyprenyl-3-methyl-5-hydroxy-6-metoxy-1,4-benzoquinol methylase
LFDLKFKCCQKADLRQRISVQDVQYAICTNCSTAFQVTPRNKIDDYYENIAPCNSGGGLKQFSKYLDMFEKNTTIPKENAVFVDIGPGNGNFLKTVKSRGYSCLGVESSDIAYKELKKKYDMFQRIEDIVVDESIIKIVTLFQVIEHIDDPLRLLDSINLSLQGRAYIVLTTPCTDSYFRKLYGAKWPSFSPHHHVILYSFKSICHLLESSGFRVIHKRFIQAGPHYDFFSQVIGWGNTLLRQQLKALLNATTGVKLKVYNTPRFIYRNSMMVIAERRERATQKNDS